jgi:hypothetical protein
MSISVTVTADWATSTSSAPSGTTTNIVNAGWSTQTSTAFAGSAAGVVLPYGYVVCTNSMNLNVVCAVGSILGPTLNDLNGLQSSLEV